MWEILLLTATILCIIHVLFNYNETARIMKKIPGPRNAFIVGNALEIMVSPAQIMTLQREFAVKFPNIYRFWSFPIAAVAIYNPEDIEVIFRNNPVYNQTIITIDGRPQSSVLGVHNLSSRKIKFDEKIGILDAVKFDKIMAYHLELIVTSTTKHSEKSVLYTFLKPWLQDGLLVSKGRVLTQEKYLSGEKWQARRKILTPTFHFNILRQFSVALRQNARRLAADLAATAARPVDVVPLISEFTLSSICETAMGTRLDEEKTQAGKEYKEAIYKMGRIVGHRACRVHLISNFIFNLTSLGRAQKKLVDIIHRFTEKVIYERKNSLSNTEDMVLKNEIEKNPNENIFMKKNKKVAMLDLLISAKRDGLIDNNGIQEEVDTFMFEGHDTTASGLTFCMLLLANNKLIQDKASEEIISLCGDDRPIEIEVLADMRYLECCIKESMRIYPPVHFISRRLTEDVKLSNYDVPAGTICHIPIIDLHNREDLFPNPSVFDPDRFLPENCARRHAYAYIPFSAGPRNCIGQKFAMLEMKLVLAELLRQFELQPVTRPEDLIFEADLVLRNNAPVYVTFTKRNKEK